MGCKEQQLWSQVCVCSVALPLDMYILVPSLIPGRDKVASPRLLLLSFPQQATDENKDALSLAL